jgi:hypothetical protein
MNELVSKEIGIIEEWGRFYFLQILQWTGSWQGKTKGEILHQL